MSKKLNDKRIIYKGQIGGAIVETASILKIKGYIRFQNNNQISLFEEVLEEPGFSRKCYF